MNPIRFVSPAWTLLGSKASRKSLCFYLLCLAASVDIDGIGVPCARALEIGNIFEIAVYGDLLQNFDGHSGRNGPTPRSDVTIFPILLILVFFPPRSNVIVPFLRVLGVVTGFKRRGQISPCRA